MLRFSFLIVLFQSLRWISSNATAVPTALPTTSRSAQNSIKTVAGTGLGATSGTGGFATSASINNPRSVVQDTVGAIYFTEHPGHCVRKFGTDNIVVAVSGQCGTSGFSGDNGKATSALMNAPIGASLDTQGVLYIGEYGSSRCRMITTSGIISTICGIGTLANNGNGGPATSAGVGGAHGIWVNSVGTVYVTAYSVNAVRMFTVGGIISAFAGTGTNGYSGDGGAATSALLLSPERVSGDTSNNIYISDSGNCRMRAVLNGNIITAFAGTGATTYNGDGQAPTSTGVYTLSAVVVDPGNGDIYFSARILCRLLVITKTTGLVTTFAGNGVASGSGDGGAATSASMNYNDGLWLTTQSQMYAAEYQGSRIRQIYSVSPTAAPTTPTLSPSFVPTVAPSVSFAPSHVRSSTNSIFLVAGTGTASSTGTGGFATAANLNDVRSVWSDTVGTLYWSESSGVCVRKITVGVNIVQNFAGVCGSVGSGAASGVATSSKLVAPIGVTGGTAGVVYISDHNSNYVSAVSTSGIISVYGGTGTASNSGNGGPATSASISAPFGNWLNSVGTLYITEYQSYMVRAIASNGIISTFAGTGTNSVSGDGGPATSAKLSSERVFGLTTGVVYVSDGDNMRVRVISASGIISSYAGTGSTAYNGDNLAPTSSNFNIPSGIAVDTSNYDVYVSDRNNHRVRVVTQTTGLMTTFAGTGTAGNSGNTGAATSCTMEPEELFMDTSLRLYLSEFVYNDVRVIYSVSPTQSPSVVPSITPSNLPTVAPSIAPTVRPSVKPTVTPSVTPTNAPTVKPTVSPSVAPSVSSVPSYEPSNKPTFDTYPISKSPSYTSTNLFAFAGIKSDGSVMSWGSACCGGDSSSVSDKLKSGVLEVVQSKNAFAALKSDGSVVAWGLSIEIAGWSELSSTSSVVESLVGNEQAFAGVTSDGGVVAFGADCCGGNVNQYGWGSSVSSGVSSVRASAGAFCALKDDGSVYCWGSKFAGGGVSSVSRSDLSGIVLLSSTRSAFAGLTSEGSVVTWGSRYFGGSISVLSASRLEKQTRYIVGGGVGFVGYTSDGLASWSSSSYEAFDVSINGSFHYVAHTNDAFAAVRVNGTLVSWGDDEMGGDSSSVSSSLKNVTFVVGSMEAFAAITSAGEVIAWGSSESGGSMYANVSSRIGSGVSEILHTSRAFAVVNGSGGVTSWGRSNMGGSMGSSLAIKLSSGVKLICSNENSFTAIKTDGTAYGWGSTQCNLGEGLLSGDFSDVLKC